MWNHLSCHTLSSVLGIVVLCPSNCHFPFICRNVRYSWWNSKKSEIFQFFSKISIFFQNLRIFSKISDSSETTIFLKSDKKTKFLNFLNFFEIFKIFDFSSVFFKNFDFFFIFQFFIFHLRFHFLSSFDFRSIFHSFWIFYDILPYAMEEKFTFVSNFC